jgi:protease IV
MSRRPLAIIFVLLGAAFTVSIAGLLAVYLFVGREPSIPSRATLALELGGDLVEMAPTNVVTYFSDARTPTVRGIVDNLRKAKTDGRVTAVLLKPTGFSSPFWGKVQELRDAIVDFKKSGKPLYAYLEYGGDREYYLASAADKVYLMPASSLDLTGVATFQLFLRGTLDKIGAYPDLHHIGDYKTASNLFTEKGYTKAHREMDESMNRDLYEQIVRGVAEGRRKSDSEVRALIDEGPFLPEDALRAGLVDDVLYEDQVIEKLRDGKPERDRTIEGDDYGRVSLTSLGLNKGPRIAVIYATGAIVSGESGYDPLNGPAVGSDTLIDSIRRARNDSSVRAIVLRIDSPGGSAVASDAVWRELMVARNERENRPIIASMSDLAASGGYYIAMPAHAIVAQPSTLTGSIGIYGGKFVTGGTYAKLGANIESTSIGRHAEINSPARPYNADERKKLTDHLQAFYDQFVEKAANARQTTPEKIDQIAQGRVWTGKQALEIGLVDALGGLDKAIALAKERAKIPADDDVEIVVYPTPKSFYELIADEFAGTGQQAAAAWLSRSLSAAEVEALRALRGPAAFFRRGEPLALMPFTFLR